MMFPSFYAILKNGEVGLFRRRAVCVLWARASGDAFVLGNFEGESHRVGYGLLTDRFFSVAKHTETPSLLWKTLFEQQTTANLYLSRICG